MGMLKMNIQFFRFDKNNLLLKFFLLSFLIFASFNLSGCVIDLSEISTHMSMTIRKAYLNQFMLPNDPNARLEEIDYHQFLRRFPDGNRYVYLFAWEVYEDTGSWQITLEETTFSFEHEVKFLVYRSTTDSFYTVEEAIAMQLFTITQFEEVLINFNIFISKS